jgi:tRNA 2-thiouridine synthesizing protein E
MKMVQLTHETGFSSAERSTPFPQAPAGWSLEKAAALAEAEGIALSEEHVKVMLDLQDYFFHHEDRINLRELHDALEEEFHIDGGIKHLYQLFPGGPIAQGCRLAGLEVPAYAKDDNFGTVM